MVDQMLDHLVPGRPGLNLGVHDNPTLDDSGMSRQVAFCTSTVQTRYVAATTMIRPVVACSVGVPETGGMGDAQGALVLVWV